MKLAVNKRTPTHWAPVREERDRLLAITDRYMAGDRLDEAESAVLQAYRKRLRDLPQTHAASVAVVWPAPPAFIRELNPAQRVIRPASSPGH